MSYQLKISPRKSKAGRFIGAVHRAIQGAFIESGLKQQELAKLLDVDRSTVNKRLLGEANLTLRSISDLAWALNKDIIFSLESPVQNHGDNDMNHLTKTSLDSRQVDATISCIVKTSNNQRQVVV